MAPEVLVPPPLTDDEIRNKSLSLTRKEKKRKKRGYGLQVDVFSYGILLWQLISLQEPYSGDIGKYVNPLNSPQVNGKRPPLRCVRSEPNIKELLQCCWCEQPNDRPTFEEIKVRLHHIIFEMTSSSTEEENKISSSSSSNKKKWTTRAIDTYF